MKKKYALLALGAFLSLAALGGIALYRGARAPNHSSQHKNAYYCPMHPSYTSDKPGTCPICNMNLVPMEEEPEENSEDSTSAGKKMCLLHKCEMANCVMELPLKPGEKVTCPVCGTHVEESEASGERAAIMLSEERRQKIGMRSEAVKRRALSVVVRATGRVAYDPDLYNAMNEHREAVKARERVQESTLADVKERVDALVRSSELRLRQMGLSDEQIREAGLSDAPTNLLVGGKGGTVWVYAQVYEYEIGLIKEGQKVEIKTPAYQGRVFHGKIKAVDPILSAETRSLKVRMEVPNPEGLLKLEMYVNASIFADIGTVLAVPEAAVLDTGDRKIAFIDLGEGRIEPRELRLGREAQGYYEILSGLSDGEKVITSANFLIDSESRLKAAFPSKGDKKNEPTPATEHRH